MTPEKEYLLERIKEVEAALGYLPVKKCSYFLRIRNKIEHELKMLNNILKNQEEMEALTMPVVLVNEADIHENFIGGHSSDTPWGKQEIIRIKAIYIKNLKMSEGKVAAQIAHAVKNLGITPTDCNIIVLGVSRKKFGELITEKNCYVQIDKGLTEVDQGTQTAAAWIDRV